MAETVHIGKAAKLAGVRVDTIRFYQKLGLLNGGNRDRPASQALMKDAQLITVGKTSIRV